MRFPPDRYPLALPIWFAPVGVGLGLVMAFFAQLVVYLVGSSLGSPISNPTPAVALIASATFDVGFVVAALYVCSLRGRPAPAQFGYVPVGWKLGVGAFVVAAVVYYASSELYAALVHLHGTDKLPSSFHVSSSTAAMLGAAAFVCVLAPICEELFFRGFLFGLLRRMHIPVGGRELGPWVAAAIVAVLFGAAHLGSAPAQFLVPLAILGFVLCLLRWRTGSLYPCMALHSFNNALALGVLLSWNLAEVVALILASWTVIAALTLPLSRASIRPAAIPSG